MSHIFNTLFLLTFKIIYPTLSEGKKCPYFGIKIVMFWCKGAISCKDEDIFIHGECIIGGIKLPIAKRLYINKSLPTRWSNQVEGSCQTWMGVSLSRNPSTSFQSMQPRSRLSSSNSCHYLPALGFSQTWCFDPTMLKVSFVLSGDPRQFTWDNSGIFEVSSDPGMPQLVGTFQTRFHICQKEMPPLLAAV